MRDKNKPRRRLVVIKLRKKGAEYFIRRDRTVGLWKIRPIAPILTGPEKKDFDARVTAGLVDSKHVGFLDTTGINSLVRLNRREGRQSVAINGSSLEIESRRCFVHFVS